MSSDDYDHFIIQKYQLIIAIAVLKTKPQNLTTADYLNQLKSKINQPDAKSDDDITICDDDITICDDDITICDDDFNMDDDEDERDSVNILKDFDFNGVGVGAKVAKNESLINVIQTLGDIEDEGNGVILNNTQSTYFDGSQELINNFINQDNDITLFEQLSQTIKQNKQNNSKTTETNKIDSQQTELYTVGLNEYNTHISQSQDNFVISKNLILNNNKNNSIQSNLSENIKDNNTVKEFNEGFNKNDNIMKHMDVGLSTSFNPSKSSSQNNKNVNSLDLSLGFDFLSTNDSQSLPISSKSDDNFVKVSSDSSQNLGYLNLNATKQTFEKGKKNQDINKTTNAGKIKHISNSYSLGEFEYSQSQNYTTNTTFNNNLNVSQNYDNVNDTLNIDNREDNDYTDFDKVNDKIDNGNSSSDEIADLTDSQAEIVTFKVLEEFSKVKSYLNRTDRSKFESGYRRFQSRYSGDSASQSCLWINESAHCLMSFIITSPLVMSTSELTEEISKVLGKLVDKLHEDEMYPNFLEELLGTIDKLLTEIYEGRNYGANILDKEELIERLFLLSRSLHIVKYTIEKITIILENTLKILTDTFEIEHTDRCENLCYIFHILEHLLHRYSRSILISSQNSTQTSQDDNTLKKSSLTEIWRKKWNLNKVDVSEGSSEKKCVLTNCSNILNKIIVQAMDGYSLISFAALQCFNLLQN